eukprot:TRINITY_DN15921_c0_g1_i2.p3 TRINITY_DN15921_c0_g1~~TRINITY_DN15921_c0_g1_i2.p3  ORF type:complete len:115 (-),score=32.21 TRINITY_DN15921_c0_g1_i2:65-409(-)
MIWKPPRSTLSSSSAASDVYKRQGKGCGGFQYEFSMDKKANDNDLAYVVQDKIFFACDDFSFQLVKGATMDFIDNGLSQTFKILDNPNAKFLCHCENSFHPTDEVLKIIENNKK